MTTRKIALNAMGIALYVVLALCLQVPVFENYYLCLGYVVMMVFCCCFGPVSGLLTGSLGVVVYCLLTNGLRGMPGWAAGNLVIGWTVGMACKHTRHIKNTWLRNGILAAVILISTALGILGVKSLVEVLLYVQPMALRVAKNSYAFVADVFVLVFSLPICASLKPVIRKLFPQEALL